MLVPLFLLATTALPLPSHPSRKMPLALADRVDRSTFICIGRVEDLVQVSVPSTRWAQSMNLGGGDPPGEVPFARVHVDRVLKGDPSTTVLFHEAARTWACDDTSAETGQRYLLLLGEGQLARAPEAVRMEVQRQLGTDVVYCNINSGDGTLLIQADDAGEFITESMVPTQMRRPASSFANRLEDVVRYVEELVRFGHDHVAVSMRCKGIGRGLEATDSGFDLRILPDGSLRLARPLGMKEKLATRRLDNAAWQLLQANLSEILGTEPRRLGDLEDHWPRRRFLVRLPNASLEFLESLDSDSNQGLESAPRADRVAALRAWAAVHDAIDCPECADYRPIDRAWMRR